MPRVRSVNDGGAAPGTALLDLSCSGHTDPLHGAVDHFRWPAPSTSDHIWPHLATSPLAEPLLQVVRIRFDPNDITKTEATDMTITQTVTDVQIGTVIRVVSKSLTLQPITGTSI